MKLRGEVDAKTFREVTAEIDAAHDQLAREHNRLASEAAMPELPDPSLAWEDLSAEDRRALTEMLIDKIVIAPHPHKIDKDGRRHYLIRAIPYQDPEMEPNRPGEEPTHPGESHSKFLDHPHPHVAAAARVSTPRPLNASVNARVMISGNRSENTPKRLRGPRAQNFWLAQSALVSNTNTHAARTHANAATQ